MHKTVAAVNFSQFVNLGKNDQDARAFIWENVWKG